MRLVPLILLALTLIACSEQKSESTQSSGGTVSCSSVSASSTLEQFSKPQSVVSHSVLSRNKLKLDLTATKLKPFSGTGDFLVDFKSMAFSSPEQVTVPSGTKLVAVVDHECTRAKGYRNRGGRGVLYSEKIMNDRAERFQDAHGSNKVHSHTIEINDDTSIAELDNLAEYDDCLVMLSSNIIFRPFIVYPPNDTNLANQTHLTSIKWDQAYNKFFDNPGISQTVVVAVIDSGLDITHADISANIWVNAGDNNTNGVDNDGNGYIDDRNGYNFASDIASPQHQAWPFPQTGNEGHGTHVAGLVGARQNNGAGVSGVFGTDQIKIMGLNVFGHTATADTATIDEAIRYAVAKNVDVINMSLGGLGQVSSTGVAIQEAITAGIVVVAAAGNSSIKLDSNNFMTPASYAATQNGMLSVGSIDVASGNRSVFSNCGNAVVEIAAPGAHNSNLDTALGGLLSTLPNSTYGRSMGTSMSSPVVAGAAALAIGLKKSLGQPYTNADIEALLKSTSTSTSSLTPYFQNGRVLNLQTLVNTISP